MLYRATGCKHCQNTGYDGRVALHELLEISPQVKRALMTVLIRRNKTRVLNEVG